MGPPTGMTEISHFGASLGKSATDLTNFQIIRHGPKGGEEQYGGPGERVAILIRLFRLLRALRSPCYQDERPSITLSKWEIRHGY